MMKKMTVVFPSMISARIKWEWLRNKYPFMWIKATSHPLTLTSVLGHEYEFVSEQNYSKLRGRREKDIVWIDDLLSMEGLKDEQA